MYASETKNHEVRAVVRREDVPKAHSHLITSLGFDYDRLTTTEIQETFPLVLVRW